MCRKTEATKGHQQEWDREGVNMNESYKAESTDGIAQGVQHKWSDIWQQLVRYAELWQTGLKKTEKSPGLHFTEDQTPDNGTTSQDPKIGEKKNTSLLLT